MSLRTCSWLLPQKEQRYGTLGPLVLLLVRHVPGTAPTSFVFFGVGSLAAASSVTADPSPPVRPASWACAIRELLSAA